MGSVVSDASETEARFNVNVPIPTMGAAGATIYAQVVTLDAGGPQGLAASQGFRVTVCP